MENVKQAELLYNNICKECSKLITKRYSTSFSLGIRLLAKEIHLPIYAIYGFVRFGDEIVDTFHSFNKSSLLQKYQKDTFEAIKQKISNNPILHSFQQVVNQYNIDNKLVEAFFNSMKMDLTMSKFNDQEYKKYIYGSAEVVGLMCLCVFLEGNKKKYLQLEPYAKSLGAAFQKVNFLRDIKSDYHERGRVYFPNIDFKNFNDNEKIKLEKEILKDFEHAHIGIKKLPKNSKKGVYLAYIYFLCLLKKIKKYSANRIIEQRIRISNAKKLVLLIKTLMIK